MKLSYYNMLSYQPNVADRIGYDYLAFLDYMDLTIHYMRKTN